MTRQTMVQLTDELVERLDQEAVERGVSRSAVIREAIERHLAGSRELALSRQILDGYRRVPQLTPDGWGSLGVQSDASAREVAQRLGAEERAQGLDPW